MADLKISQLSAATALAGTEVVPVVQGGATKKATIDQILAPASGKGVNFSAAGGNTLTQYKEAVFTAGMTADTGTIALSYDKMNYTRVGRLVTLSGEIVVSSVSSPTGDVYLSLPFTSAINTSGRSGLTSVALGLMYSYAGVPLGQLIGVINANDTKMAVRILNNFSQTSLSSYLQAGTAIEFGFTYQCQ